MEVAVCGHSQGKQHFQEGRGPHSGCVWGWQGADEEKHVSGGQWVWPQLSHTKELLECPPLCVTRGVSLVPQTCLRQATLPTCAWHCREPEGEPGAWRQVIQVQGVASPSIGYVVSGKSHPFSEPQFFHRQMEVTASASCGSPSLLCCHWVGSCLEGG